ncbi:MAG: Flp family type IVb pilin [Chloroflexota bacterium]
MPTEPDVRSLGRSPAGQGLVEYGIVLGCSILVVVVLLVFFDDQVAAALDWLSSQLP